MNNFTIVILAAGLGTRLGDLTKDKPKALTLVNGKPIIQYSIEFANLLKPKKIIVVGGYLFDKLQTAVKEIDNKVIMVENKEFATTQRMLSLIAVRPEIEGGLLSFDGDYIYHPDVVEVVKPELNSFKIFGTSHQGNGVDLDLVVETDNNLNIKKMTKGAKNPLEKNEYFFASLMYCPEEKLKDYFKAADRTITKIGADKTHVEEALMEYVESGDGKVKIFDMGKPKWIEVDNIEELKVAEKMFV